MPVAMAAERRALMVAVDKVCEVLRIKFRRNQEAIGGRIPVGGEHMEDFFKIEALEGFQSAMRKGRPQAEAVRVGKERSALAVDKWNGRREWQVHYWRETAWDFLDNVVVRTAREVAR